MADQGGGGGFGAALMGGLGGGLGSGIAGLGLGLLGGLFNKAPEQNPQLRDLYNAQVGIANQLGDFANSVPLSSPQELGALAEQRGLLGQQERAGQERLFADIGQNQGMGNVGDLLKNLISNQTGQQGALTSQMLQQALQARRQALLQRSGVLQAAFGPAAAPKQPGVDLSGPLSQAAYAYFNKGTGGGATPPPPPNVVGNPSGSPFGGGIPQASATGAPTPVATQPVINAPMGGQGGGMMLPSQMTPQLQLPPSLMQKQSNPFASNPWLG